MKFVPTSLVDGQRVVAVKGVELERKIKRCENLVVGVFVGKRLAYNLVKRVTERAWKPKGCLFTWCNEQQGDGRIASNLDRILVNLE